MKVENIATFAKVRRLYEAMLEDLQNINKEFELVIDLESKKVEVVLYNNVIGSFDIYNGELECGNRFWINNKVIDILVKYQLLFEKLDFSRFKELDYYIIPLSYGNNYNNFFAENEDSSISKCYCFSFLNKEKSIDREKFSWTMSRDFTNTQSANINFILDFEEYLDMDLLFGDCAIISKQNFVEDYEILKKLPQDFANSL